MTLFLIIHILISVVLIALVFMQYGRGGDMTAGMGGGGSANSVFGASGSADFISKLTGVVGVLFFMSSLGVGAMYKRGLHSDQPLKSLMQDYVPKLPSGSVPVSPSPSVPQQEKVSVSGGVAPALSDAGKLKNETQKKGESGAGKNISGLKEQQDTSHSSSVNVK